MLVGCNKSVTITKRQQSCRREYNLIGHFIVSSLPRPFTFCFSLQPIYPIDDDQVEAEAGS